MKKILPVLTVFALLLGGFGLAIQPAQAANIGEGDYNLNIIKATGGDGGTFNFKVRISQEETVLDHYDVVDLGKLDYGYNDGSGQIRFTPQVEVTVSSYTFNQIGKAHCLAESDWWSSGQSEFYSYIDDWHDYSIRIDQDDIFGWETLGSISDYENDERVSFVPNFETYVN